MSGPGTSWPVYLDQNIISHLRAGKKTREKLMKTLKALQENNAILVCSMTHVDECRASSRPEQFVTVIDELRIYLMEFQKASDPKTTFVTGKAQKLILEAEGAGHLAQQWIEDLLRIWHFASGWLGEVQAQEIKSEMIVHITSFWVAFRREVDRGLLGPELQAKTEKEIYAAEQEMFTLIENMPFEKLKTEWEFDSQRLKERLPANPAQLDQIPDEKAVAFVLSCLEEQSRELIQNQFPQGLWKKLESREEGHLASLALILFMCGLVRDRRVKKGKTQRRLQHFLGQFRDGVHIENAARCAMFVTCDQGVARLARSIFAYSGVETVVAELKIDHHAPS